MQEQSDWFDSAGKTRLALEVARAAQFEFANGAHFVELAPFREPALVLSAMLAAVRPGQSTNLRPPLDALKHALQPLDVLLVLDNLEQVLEAAPQLADILATSPTLTILATSRAPLRLSWENEVPLSPLEVPPSRVHSAEDLLAYPSVELLVEHMAALGVRGYWNGAELASLAGVCRRLGHPACAGAGSRACQGAATIPAACATRAAVGSVERRHARQPNRHQALRTTFAWSYEPLGESDRRRFGHLSVFVGGCTFDAAARASALSTRARSPSSMRWVDSSTVVWFRARDTASRASSCWSRCANMLWSNFTLTPSWISRRSVTRSRISSSQS
jgi:predicted ATPase